MEHQDNCFFQDLYSEQLSSIKGINFTRREVEVIACLLNARGTSKIASFLALAPKTVVNHIFNIKQKVGCNTRDGIIDFVEGSNELLLLRKHYSNLLIQVAFEKSLKEISRLVREAKPSCTFVYWGNEDLEFQKALIFHLESHFKLAGFVVLIECREDFHSFSDFNHSSQKEGSIIYVMPRAWLEDGRASAESLQVSQKQGDIYFVFSTQENESNFVKKIKSFDCIDLTETGYIFSIFEALKKILLPLSIEKIIVEFKEKYESIQNVGAENSSKIIAESEILEDNKSQFLSEIIFHLKEKKLYVLFVLFIACLFGWGFLKFHEPKKMPVWFGLSGPPDPSLLHRPDLLAVIDEQLKGRDGIQTVALVGIGGAGKTTLSRQYARQYAHKQKANVICAVNAETNQSLNESFEGLAQALSKIEEDRKALIELREIKNPIEREERIIQFVKEKLRFLSNWVLVFDNVEKFSDIQKHFPQDPETWGSGKVLLTTRDNHIQNNKYVNRTIFIGELNKSQKLDLFIQSMNHGATRSFAPKQYEETKIFLDEIPPYPLDVSIAACYLKVTNISYNDYLKKLDSQNNDFIEIQKNILKESGDYVNTRYGIISLSLNNIINSYEDFKGLILFITLLDSQDIPRELLEKYKDPLIIDKFLYALKKHSLITNENFTSLNSTFSIHRSTQKIGLAYLIKTLALEKNEFLLKSIFQSLEKYMADIIETQSFLKLKNTIKHVEVFLTHNYLLNKDEKGNIESKLGEIYAQQLNGTLAKKILEKCLENLNKHDPKNYDQMAQVLSALGNAYWNLGDFEKAADFQEQALLIYKKHFSKNYLGVARTLVLLGHYTRDLGKYKKAKSSLERSLAIYKKHYPENHPRVNWAFSTLGFIYFDLGEYKKAQDIFEKCLSIYEKHYPENYQGIARTLIFLAYTYRKLGDYKKAKDFVEQGLHLQKKHFSSNNYQTKWALYLLGNIYSDLGHYEKAKDLLKEALAFSEIFYGKNHFETARVLQDLGILYFLEGNIEISENFIYKSYKTFKQNNHPEIYTCLESLADLYLKKSRDANNKGNPDQSHTFKNQAIGYLIHALEVVKTIFQRILLTF